MEDAGGEGVPQVAQLLIGSLTLVQEGLEQFVIEPEPVPGGRAKKRAGLVKGDLARPGTEVRPRLEIAEFLPHHHAGPLEDVGGIMVVVNKVVDMAQNPSLVSRKQVQEFAISIVVRGSRIRFGWSHDVLSGAPLELPILLMSGQTGIYHTL